MIRIFRIRLVRGTITEMQVQAIRAFADENALLCKRDSRRDGTAHICKKDAFPDRGAGSTLDVLHIQNRFWKALVKDSRLNLKRCLRRLEAILQSSKGGLGTRGNVDAVR